MSVFFPSVKNGYGFQLASSIGSSDASGDSGKAEHAQKALKVHLHYK
jgi:hypothetical protein